jgi:ubiquinol-cytochrome c reductase iron-sulfur subunit
MNRPLRWLLGLLVLARSLRPPPREPPPPRIVARGEPNPRAELIVAALLLGTAAAAVVAVVAYGLGWGTQALGGALAGAFALVAIALIVAARHLVVTEQLAEPYPCDHPGDQGAVVQIVRESGDRITRKRLLGSAAGLAGGALGAALIAPAVSLGPVFQTRRLQQSPWHRGRALVDEDGKPIAATDIDPGAFYTAFPQGADPKAIASPLIVLRLDPAQVRLRKRWAPEGIVAYSKICTHAGCAIALYRNPLFKPAEPSPALVCPCHYSTFDPADGGKVLYGPAGRPLPQLPLMLDGRRRLRAAGDYSSHPGPSWWGVRRT